jgi:DNA repair protein RadD
MKKLRDYQNKAISMARSQFANGLTKIMIWLATGGGKSVIFGQLAYNLRKAEKRVIFVVRRRQLIFQAQKHLKSWGLNVGVVIAGKKVDPTKPVQVCSIDTIRARMNNGDLDFLKDFEAVIVDECHDCTSPSYHKFFEYIGMNKIYFGLTATPFEVGNKVHDFWQSCVKPIEVHELKEKGFLTDATVFMSHSVDTSGLKAQATGDYKNKEVFDMMAEKRVVGNIVEEYQRLGKNKPAILFAVNIEHSEMMAKAFNEAGIPAIHCDQSTPQGERDEAINKLATGKIKVLCNVNIFSTGVDIPQAEVGIMARPTASEILYIQQLGRLLRPYKVCGSCKTERGAEKHCHVCGSEKVQYNKEKAIILDHGENTGRFGLPFDIREAVLTEEDLQIKKGKKREIPSDVKIIRVRECKSCFACNPLSAKVCLDCGEKLGSDNAREIKTTDGTLIECTPEAYFELQKKRARDEYNKLKSVQLQNDYKLTWVYFKLKDKFKNNPKPCQDIVPKWFYRKWVHGEFDG